MTLTRRGFAKGLGVVGLAGASSFAAPALFAAGQTTARVVVIGGGAGGASVAVQLKQAAPTLDITIVEKRRRYPTCFQSNLYLGGLRSFASLVHDYDGLRALGIKIVTETALDVDTVAKLVKLGGNRTIAYDRLVLSPGIALKFDAIEGYSEAAAEVMPHSWEAGPQTILLKRQLAGMRNGGTVVIAAPAMPYRCPPAPYERACMIAHYLKTHKPKSKLIVLDAKKAYSKQALFEDAFATHYKDIVEVALTNEIDDNRVVRVDIKSREVVTKSGRKIVADVANIIPPQRAGDIAGKVGVTVGDWSPVKLDSFRSAKVADVYVLGDSAQAPDMPKSAYSANSQANVVVADLLADLVGKDHGPAQFENYCWSCVSPGNSVKIGARYAPGEKDGKPLLVASGSFLSARDETDEVRRRNYEDSLAWYDGLTAGAFPEAPTVVAPSRGHRRHRV